MVKILAFAGSIRKDAYSKKVVRIAAEGAKSAGAEVTFIDLRDYPMPVYDPDEHLSSGFHPLALEFQDLLAAHDGLLICSPEYNGSIPGGLKNVIDWTSRKSEKFATAGAYKGKFAAIMSSSPGSFGGIRCLSHLRGVLSILFVNVLPTEIAVTFVAEKFNDEGEMTDEKTKKILENLGASLAEMLVTTKGRGNAV